MTDRYDEFEAKLRALVGEYADVLAPKRCKLHGIDEEDCPCDPKEMGEPVPGVMMTEWFLGSAWVELDHGGQFFDYCTNNGALLSHTLGLLQLCQMKVEEQVP